MKKKYLALLLALVLILTCVTMAACKKDPVKVLRAEIKDHGKLHPDSKMYKVELTDSIDLYYFDDSDRIWLSYFSSDTSFFLFY